MMDTGFPGWIVMSLLFIGLRVMYASGGYANFQAAVGFNNYGLAAAFMRIRDLS